MEAASASLTVSFTDCIRFWALWTSISVACLGKGSEVNESNMCYLEMGIVTITCSDSSSLMFVRPSMVALTVERIFN